MLWPYYPVTKVKKLKIRFLSRRNLIYLFFLTLVTLDKRPTKAAQSEFSKMIKSTMRRKAHTKRRTCPKSHQQLPRQNKQTLGCSVPVTPSNCQVEDLPLQSPGHFIIILALLFWR